LERRLERAEQEAMKRAEAAMTDVKRNDERDRVNSAV
jgi:hypothetical protein